MDETMNRQEIRAEISRVARQKLDWDQPLPTGAIVEDLDSLQLMTLVVEIEDVFEIELDPEDEARIKTIDDLVDVITRKLGGELW